MNYNTDLRQTIYYLHAASCYDYDQTFDCLQSLVLRNYCLAAVAVLVVVICFGVVCHMQRISVIEFDPVLRCTLILLQNGKLLDLDVFFP